MGIDSAPFLEDWSRKNSEIKPPLYFKNQDTLTGHDLSSFTKYRIYYETKLPVLILNQQSETAVLIYEPFQTLFNEFTNSPIKKILNLKSNKLTVNDESSTMMRKR